MHTRKHAAITHTCLAGDAAQFRFAGEPFVHTKIIFDKIEDMGVCAAEGKRYYLYRITYDIKTFTDAEDTPQSCYEAMQRLMSISICSNVPGFMDPTCFVSEGDSRDVVGRFVNYMLLIARRAKRNMQHKFRFDLSRRTSAYIDHYHILLYLYIGDCSDGCGICKILSLAK